MNEPTDDDFPSDDDFPAMLTDPAFVTRCVAHLLAGTLPARLEVRVWTLAFGEPD